MNRLEYIITCLGEEASEITKEASKINRFGLDDKNPSENLTHKEKLINEIHDLLAVYEMLLSEINEDFILDNKKIIRKKEKMENMIKLSKKLGRIS